MVPLHHRNLAAAVVLKGEVGKRELADFCREHMADFKVPRQFFVVSEIPRTSTGKIQRRHVAAAFTQLPCGSAACEFWKPMARRSRLAQPALTGWRRSQQWTLSSSPSRRTACRASRRLWAQRPGRTPSSSSPRTAFPGGSSRRAGRNAQRAAAHHLGDAGAGRAQGHVQSQMRQEIWLKLIGDASLNPVSALTRATPCRADGRCRHEGPDPLSHARSGGVGRAPGIEPDIGVDRRLDGAARVGEHRTSMLQDVEAGRPLEVEALVGSVIELGHQLDGGRAAAYATARHIAAARKLVTVRTSTVSAASAKRRFSMAGPNWPTVVSTI